MRAEGKTKNQRMYEPCETAIVVDSPSFEGVRLKANAPLSFWSHVNVNWFSVHVRCLTNREKYKVYTF